MAICTDLTVQPYCGEIATLEKSHTSDTGWTGTLIAKTESRHHKSLILNLANAFGNRFRKMVNMRDPTNSRTVNLLMRIRV